MPQDSLVARLQAICGRSRLDPSLTREIVGEAADYESQVQALRAERDRMKLVLEEIVTLIKPPSPNKLIHELRNVLNELSLLKALVDTEEEEPPMPPRP